MNFKNLSDPVWISENISDLGGPVTSVNLTPLLGSGGLNNAMHVLTVTVSDTTETKQTDKRFIVKSTASEAASLSLAQHLGLAREAFFLLSPNGRIPAKHLPQVKFAHGDMVTGEKIIIMDELSSHIQSGYLFGKCSPHNWAKDLESVTGIPEGPQRQEMTRRVTRHAFEAAAKVHAAFWKDSTILDRSWMRASDWMQGEGQASWEAAQKAATDCWAEATKKIAEGQSSIQWNPKLLQCMDASFAKISWQEYRRKVMDPDHVFTLVHGDYHPANMMWKFGKDGEDEDSLIILDWEVVGFGSGPQDCAQYLISHMYPHEQRMWEGELIQAYHSMLVQSGVDQSTYPLDHCKKDFVSGGIARWVWLFAHLAAKCPDDWVKYFHDQLAAFIEDHHITPDNIEMPRV
ncbi:hypothetical protein HDU80_003638 [Chytriomyces hyalinus]|nr:hypothetical protein HDU80_003638 [Chytriomyces hyalinus]